MKTRLVIMMLVILINIASSPILASVPILDSELPAGTISGKIVDQVSGQFIEYASVALYKATDSTIITGIVTNNEGTFRFEKVEDGNYYLKITFVGYKDKDISNINVSKRTRTIDLGSIKLTGSETQLEEVVVAGEKSRIQYKIDKRVIEVDKDITAKGGSAVDVLENTPSVQVDAQGNLTLRGSSDYVVLVDGKPSILKGSDALKQIASDAIKQIEVITNPSAKYEADGHAGIINIIMKKEKMQGFNGNFNMGYGNFDKLNAGLLLNYRKGKFNFFGGIDFADNTYNSNIKIDNKTFYTTEIQYIKQNVNQWNTNQNLGLKGGFDFDINDKNALSIAANIGRQGYDHGSDATTNISSSEQAYNNYYKSEIYTDITGDVTGLNLDYTHKFSDTHKLMISSSYSSWKGVDANKLTEQTTNEFYEEGETSTSNQFNKDNGNYQYRLNIDYSRPVLKGNFEAGTQFRYEYRMEDFIFENFETSGNSWIKNQDLSYYLDYFNTIYSGYATYNNKILGIGYQLGLRSEYFMRSIDIDTEPEAIDYNKFMFYPSLHFSKDFNEKNQMQLSYSRRINRPQPWLLNNTPQYIDPRNIFKGSPYLIPEYTDAFELNYRTMIKKVKISIQTYYRNTSNSFVAIRSMGDDGIMYHQLANSENQQSAGMEFGFDFGLFKWWQVNTNMNVYNYKLKTVISNTDKIQDVNTWDARLVNNFSLKWETKLQSVLYYRAPGVDAMGESSGYFTTSFAISQPLLKNKASISISADNLINKTKFEYIVKTPEFDNNYQISFERPQIRLNFSYNFNNFQNKNRGRRDDLDFKGGGGF